MILVIIINERDETMLQRTLGSGWGVLLPGCTGLWQVTKRNEADFDEMVWLDIVYINHSGILEDLKLIIKTIGVVIHPNGAY